MTYDQERFIRLLRRVFEELSTRDGTEAWVRRALPDLMRGQITVPVLEAAERYLREERPDWIFDDAQVLRLFNRVMVQHGRLAPLGRTGSVKCGTVIRHQGVRYAGY